MRKFFVVVLALHMVVMCQDLFCQEESESSRKRRSWWLNGGFGCSTLGSVGGALGANVQLNDLLLTLRVSGGQDTVTFTFTDAEINHLSDTAVLVGLVMENRKRHVSFSAGIARVTGYNKEKNVDTIGFPLQTQLFLKASRVVGIGVNIFANLNSERSFGGIALSLNVGRLR